MIYIFPWAEFSLLSDLLMVSPYVARMSCCSRFLMFLRSHWFFSLRSNTSSISSSITLSGMLSSTWAHKQHMNFHLTKINTYNSEKIGAQIPQHAHWLTLSSSWAETRQCSGSMSDLGRRGGTWEKKERTLDNQRLDELNCQRSEEKEDCDQLQRGYTVMMCEELPQL